MASVSKLRKLLLENPAAFSDQEIAGMIKGGVANLYEISKTGGLGPFRKKKIEDILNGKEIQQAPPEPYQPYGGMQTGAPGQTPPAPQPGRPRFPVPRQEERRPRSVPLPPPLPQRRPQSPRGPLPPPPKPGPWGPGPSTPPNYGY